MALRTLDTDEQVDIESKKKWLMTTENIDQRLL